ncbi:MAG: branched-chain amino acid ABC transporter permease [Candidatus Kapabacteria bacterium]|nr:branched-chain amino acid ABC transporter permease [Candidatus Kapabacteria bacterium]
MRTVLEISSQERLGQLRRRLVSSKALPLILALAGASLFGIRSGSYHLGLANLVCIAIMGAVSQGLLLGWAGQVSLGYAAFFAVGGMAAALLSRHLEVEDLLVGVPAAFVAAAIAGAAVGTPAARMKGLYLAVSSLAFHFVLIYLIGQYQHSIGASEVVSVASPSLGGVWTIRGTREWYFVLLAASVLAVVACANLERSAIGRAWKTIHHRETVAAAFGVRPYYFKLLAFAISSGLAGAAGALDAYYNGFVAQDRYSVVLTIQTLAMIILGGMGSLLGWVFGAVCITLLPFGIEHAMQAFATQARLQSYVFQIQQAAFGLILFAVLVLEPTGLAGLWGRAHSMASRALGRARLRRVGTHEPAAE